MPRGLSGFGHRFNNWCFDQPNLKPCYHSYPILTDHMTCEHAIIGHRKVWCSLKNGCRDYINKDKKEVK